MRLRGDELASRLAALVRPGWRTRFAPAPTGWLHLGHVLNAVYVWGLARRLDGVVVLRIEDHDRGRCKPEYERGILEDLAWLGLEPDVGTPDEFRGGAAMYRQSDRQAAYEGALGELESKGLVYPCGCSRRDIATVSRDVFGEETRYPGTCRERAIDPASTPARRVRMDPGAETFIDVALGEWAQSPDEQCGDVLVRDRSGHWTYQFAVSVDDLTHDIDVVIRGDDLLASTGRQCRLGRLLGRATPPVTLHHTLLLTADGRKLSKSARDTGVRDLRAAGWSAAQVLGAAAHLGGLQASARPLAAGYLADLFAD